MEPDAHLSPVVPEDRPDAYPEDLEREVILEDGTTVTMRPVVPADIERLRHAFDVGDSDSIRRRFLTGAPPSDETHLHYLVEIDYRRRLALIVFDVEGNSVGIARYEGATDPSAAEIAVVVDPEWRHRGVGNLLLTALEAPARDAGFSCFTAVYSLDNRAIAELLSELGYVDRHFEDGLIAVAKPLV